MIDQNTKEILKKNIYCNKESVKVFLKLLGNSS